MPTKNPGIQIAEPNRAKGYLLRSWGRDIEAAVALRKPDAKESTDGEVGFGVACWWFTTAAERAAFEKSLPPDIYVVHDRNEPGPDWTGEIIDTHKLTVAKIVLRHPDGREARFEITFGYGYPEHSARYMFEEGNYSCDCNRAAFAGWPESSECGDTIELVSLEIEKLEMPIGV